MKFRPCIDLHEGRVKQIVGGTLTDGGAAENFVSDKSAEHYAQLYARDRLTGGHVIMLGPGNADAARAALAAYPGGLHVGGGVTAANAAEWLAAGASHVIVTSWLFEGPSLSRERAPARSPNAWVGLAAAASRRRVALRCSGVASTSSRRRRVPSRRRSRRRLRDGVASMASRWRRGGVASTASRRAERRRCGRRRSYAP